MPSLSFSSMSRLRRRIGSALTSAERVRLTMLTVCWARARLALVDAVELEGCRRGREDQQRDQQERARKQAHRASDASRLLSGLRIAVGHEYVAEAPDRLDEARMRVVILDDLAQARDLHVDRAVE